MTRVEAMTALADMHRGLEAFTPRECDRAEDLLRIIYGNGTENPRRARQSERRQIPAGGQHAKAPPGKQTPKGRSCCVGPGQEPTAGEEPRE